MKHVVSVLAWGTGMLGLFIGVPLLIIGSLFIGPRSYSGFARATMRMILFFFLVRVRVSGLERVDASRPHLFIANHASFFDFFILAAYLPGFTRGFEAAEHFTWPVWGLFLRRAGLLPADRSSAAASLRGMKQAAKKIRDEGMSFLILPEGTRTLTGAMLPFKRLPFFLAKEAGCDIVPVGLKGTFRIKNKNSWIIRPGRADMIFDEPIDARTIAALELEDLAALARERVAVLINREVGS